MASILVDKRFKLKKKPKNEVVHHFQIQDVWKNVSDISLGTETNLYSFDGFQQKLALRKIRCGLPTGNHRARQFSRKYAILKRAYLYLYIHTYICNCIFLFYQLATTRPGNFSNKISGICFKSQTLLITGTFKSKTTKPQNQVCFYLIRSRLT